MAVVVGVLVVVVLMLVVLVLVLLVLTVVGMVVMVVVVGLVVYRMGQDLQEHRPRAWKSHLRHSCSARLIIPTSWQDR